VNKVNISAANALPLMYAAQKYFLLDCLQNVRKQWRSHLIHLRYAHRWSIALHLSLSSLTASKAHRATDAQMDSHFFHLLWF